jgi:hypothetical protein
MNQVALADSIPTSTYIEGILHKKGNAVFRSVWSLRFFELDVTKQKLRWYRCQPGGKKGVLRGEIHLAKATAFLKTEKQSASKLDRKGHLVSLKYIPTNSSAVSEMVLLSSTLDEAYQWIAHTNKAGSFYDVASPGILEEIKKDIRAVAVSVVRNIDIASDNTNASSKERAIDMVCEPVAAEECIQTHALNVKKIKDKCFDFIRNMIGDMFWFWWPIFPLFLSPQYQSSVFVVLIYALYFWKGGG